MKLMGCFACMLICAAVVVIAEDVFTSSDNDMSVEMFKVYMKQYNKSYSTLGMEQPLWKKRFGAFKQNVNRITRHNLKYQQGTYTFQLGLNGLADLTDEEYEAMLRYKVKSGPSRVHDVFTTSNITKKPADSWDWREHNVVTPVKNQGACGSCWSFSAVASLESAYALRSKKLVSLSEQELIDCTLGGIDTCTHGGEMQDGILEIINNHNGRIDTEAQYPYIATSRGMCKADDSKGVGHFTSVVNVTSGDEEALKSAVYEHGVVSVGIDASSFMFQLYRHGVFSWPWCKNSPQGLDHGVAVAGYGIWGGKEFWLVKNSWGKSWGMEGYIMMARGKKNMCGIATNACYAVAGKD